MKLKSFLIFLLLLQAGFIKAQKADTAHALIHYKFTHVRDTNNRDKPLTENMLLLIGRSASAYKSYDRQQRNEQMRKSVAEQVNSGSANIRVTAGGAGLGPDVEYYQYPNEKKLYTKERVFNNYVIEENLPLLNWKISSDTATIGGLQCQKATTRFKGRDYTAWFCADLPYRAGPWKLNGLPGLIVEAYDARNEVVFKFDGLEKVDPAKQLAASTSEPGININGRSMVLGGIDDGGQNPYLIALPANSIKTTPKELDELKEIRRKDPQAFLQSQMAAMRGQMGAGGRSFSMNGGGAVADGNQTISVQRAPGNTQVETNNPIELPERK